MADVAMQATLKSEIFGVTWRVEVDFYMDDDVPEVTEVLIRPEAPEWKGQPISVEFTELPSRVVDEITDACNQAVQDFRADGGDFLYEQWKEGHAP